MHPQIFVRMHLQSGVSAEGFVQKLVSVKLAKGEVVLKVGLMLLYLF